MADNEYTGPSGDGDEDVQGGIYGFDRHKNRKRVTPATTSNERNKNTKEALTDAKYALTNANLIFEACSAAVNDTKDAFDLIATVLTAHESATGGDGETVTLIEQMQSAVDLSLGTLSAQITECQPLIAQQVTDMESYINKIR